MDSGLASLRSHPGMTAIGNSSAARIVWSAPAAPSFPSPSKKRGWSAARRWVTETVDASTVRPMTEGARLTALHWRRFLSPGRAFGHRVLPGHQPAPGRRTIVSTGRSPGASRDGECESPAQAPHQPCDGDFPRHRHRSLRGVSPPRTSDPLRLRRLMKRPSASRVRT